MPQFKLNRGKKHRKDVFLLTKGDVFKIQNKNWSIDGGKNNQPKKQTNIEKTFLLPPHVKIFNKQTKKKTKQNKHRRDVFANAP